MKTIFSILFIGSFILLVGCKNRHTSTVKVNAKNGSVTFLKKNTKKGKGTSEAETVALKKQQYLTKSDNLTIEVTGIKPNQTATIEATQSYQSITSEPELTNPFSVLLEASSVEPTNDVNEKISEVEGDIDKTKREETIPLTAENSKLKELKLVALERKKDSLEILKLFNEGSDIYHRYYSFFYSASSEEYLVEKSGELKKEIKIFIDKVNLTKVVAFSNLNEKYTNLQIELNDLYNYMVSYSFSQKLEIFPYKERVDVTVDIKTSKITNNAGTLQTTTVTNRIYESQFITRRSFKMLVSVGLHTLISDGATVRNYANFDSTIVDRKGSNVVPSFGTYINATWRVRDALVGFGLGTGIPFSGDEGSDLTPNFSLFGTTLFQTDAGRMGFNIGVGLRKVNYLSPGYSVGDEISPEVTVIPTFGRWRPTFMVGVSYTIPEKGTN